MRILFIAPIFPEIGGQVKASVTLLKALKNKEYDVRVVNLGKESLKSGLDSLNRFFDIFKILVQIFLKRKGNNIIYLSLAESFLGNMRDIFIYILCYQDRSKMVVHMLGGTGMRKILESNGLQQKINKFFLSKVGGVIIEGEMNLDAFKKVIPEDRIYIINNFAEDYLFVEDAEIEEKFAKMNPLQILFLSNLIPGKGYDELADAYISLDAELKNQLSLVYVGGFDKEEDEKDFFKKIEKEDGIKYLGRYIEGPAKRSLYCKSHVFCLPTYYPFEGQPISIFEGYATGCVVISSNHSGIPYVFFDKKNGFMVEKKSVKSLQKALIDLILNKNELKKIAVNNRNEAAKKFRTSIFQNKILDVFDKLVSHQ